MTGNDKKTKADPAPKTDPASKKEPSPKDASAAGDATPSKAEGSEAAAPPSNYSRGEGQKPVTQAYKDNWNAIFGQKPAKKTAKKRKK